MGAGDGDGPRPNHGLEGLVPKPKPKPPHEHDSTSQQPVPGPTNYAVAGKVLLALVALHLYSTSRRRRLGGGRQRRRLLRSLALAGDGADDDRDGAPRGLDPAVLAAIPVVVVDDGAGAGGGGDCAVCLAELERGEKARALPRCGHRFHVECIDAWFRGNATCPLCRADVVVAPSAAAPSAPADGGALPEVRIDVAGDAVAAPANNRSMARLPSGTDLEKARRVFASTRFSSF